LENPIRLNLFNGMLKRRSPQERNPFVSQTDTDVLTTHVIEKEEEE